MENEPRRHGGTENQGLFHEELTDKIISTAIEIHRHLGPGLLESAYEQCFCHELSLRGIPHRRQSSLPLEYKGLKLDGGYRIDVIVNRKVIVELKCIEKILPVHEAQLLTYLKLSGTKVSLIINFNAARIKDGIKRMAL